MLLGYFVATGVDSFLHHPVGIGPVHLSARGVLPHQGHRALGGCVVWGRSLRDIPRLRFRAILGKLWRLLLCAFDDSLMQRGLIRALLSTSISTYPRGHLEYRVRSDFG